MDRPSGATIARAPGARRTCASNRSTTVWPGGRSTFVSLKSQRILRRSASLSDTTDLRIEPLEYTLAPLACQACLSRCAARRCSWGVDARFAVNVDNLSKLIEEYWRKTLAGATETPFFFRSNAPA